MNEEMKRLIEVLNGAGYEVVSIRDTGSFEGVDRETKEPCYLSSGFYELKVVRKPRA